MNFQLIVIFIPFEYNAYVVIAFRTVFYRFNPNQGTVVVQNGYSRFRHDFVDQISRRRGIRLSQRKDYSFFRFNGRFVNSTKNNLNTRFSRRDNNHTFARIELITILIVQVVILIKLCRSSEKITNCHRIGKIGFP